MGQVDDKLTPRPRPRHTTQPGGPDSGSVTGDIIKAFSAIASAMGIVRMTLADARAIAASVPCPSSPAASR